MVVDMLMAFVIALFLEMLSSINKYFKQIAIFINCILIIFIYFICGCRIDFIGEMDLSIWIVFVIMFDEVLMSVFKK